MKQREWKKTQKDNYKESSVSVKDLSNSTTYRETSYGGDKEQAQKLFCELEHELMTNEKPSLYLNTLLSRPEFYQYPFSMLASLEKTEQSPKYHPEGNVWIHTLMVVDVAASEKVKSERPREIMWAALLHDIGKPETTRFRKGRITSYDHDRVGAALADKFLSEFVTDREFIRYVCSLIRWHMMILYVNKDLPFGDLQTMLNEVRSEDLAILGWSDRTGRSGIDKKAEKESIELFYKKAKSIE